MIEKKFLNSLPQKCGVYQIFNFDKKIIYIGKAKNLKKRVGQYYTGKILDIKTIRMISQSRHIEYVVTETELEAFLLEAKLIKLHKPKYNIFMRDDKSFPYIIISSHDYPSILITRKKNLKGEYFGPYISADSIKHTLDILQKIIPFRQCSDIFFRNRVRPCLQYQIKRCSAPCVEKINKKNYQNSIFLIREFLQGKNFSIIKNFSKSMQYAAEKLDFESAIKYRNKISLLRSIQNQPMLNQISKCDKDFIIFLQKNQKTVIHILKISKDRILSSKSYFPFVPKGALTVEIIESFLTQYYISFGVSKNIYLNYELDSKTELVKHLSHHSKCKISIKTDARGKNKRLMNLAIENAQANLMQSEIDELSRRAAMQEIQGYFNFPTIPRRIECFDISHTNGNYTIASCVVFIDGQASNKKYRRYNLDNIQNDDYAAMREVLSRRYAKVLPENKPNLIVIDGGKGQLSQAVMVLDSVGLIVDLISIAKDKNRKSGLETLFSPSNLEGVKPVNNEGGFLMLQHIRDEAHRFAITGHRQRRLKMSTRSSVENIYGIGAKTRQKLLQHFGGLEALKTASMQEIIKVEGVSEKIAQKVVDYFNDS